MNENNKFIFDYGKNNIIELPDIKKTGLLPNIQIYGNNNSIFAKDMGPFAGYIIIGMPDCEINNCKIKIGKESASNGVTITLYEDNSEVNIGENCMFSNFIYMATSDGHTITDMQGNIINHGGKLTIGNNVWIGINTYIGKNVEIPDGCVVGMGSIVTTQKTFPKNCIIAGNPAKVVKKGIKWSKLRMKQYIEQYGAN